MRNIFNINYLPKKLWSSPITVLRVPIKYINLNTRIALKKIYIYNMSHSKAVTHRTRFRTQIELHSSW